MEDHYELLKQYALNNENYQGWRKEHTKMFGEIFSAAFEDNEEAQIYLTVALMHIAQRRFEAAIPNLSILESICVAEYDCAAVDYFMGLNCEMMGREEEMNDHYDRLKASRVFFVFPLVLHPYYRTAKLAQREAECSKAVFYYRKALAFYDGAASEPRIKASVGQIIYDIATVYLYMHAYGECERFLEWSRKYDRGENQHRTYVTAILYAAQGKAEESLALLSKLSPFLRQNCEPAVKAILGGTDLHYCAVPQSRSGYSDFWRDLLSKKDAVETMVYGGEALDAQRMVSEGLSRALSFARRQIDCQIEWSEDVITVFCKTYYINTLAAEYEALFETKPHEFNAWRFISVDEFEDH